MRRLIPFTWVSCLEFVEACLVEQFRHRAQNLLVFCRYKSIMLISSSPDFVLSLYPPHGPSDLAIPFAHLSPLLVKFDNGISLARGFPKDLSRR